MRVILGFLLGVVIMAFAYENGAIRVNDTVPRLVADLKTTAQNLWQDIRPNRDTLRPEDRQSSLSRNSPDA